MATNVHPKGTPRRLDNDFKDISGQLANPTTVTLRITTPSGVTTEYTTPAIVQASTGKFYYDLTTITESGRWLIRWKGVGVVDAADEYVLFIKPSDFTLPPP